MSMEWPEISGTHPPALLPHHVHIYCIPITNHEGTLTKLELLLDTSERERGARYRNEHAKHTFVCARASLRAILSLYLNTQPQHLTWQTEEHGKPRLADAWFAQHPIEFNVSHSGAYALIAISYEQRLGVDLEDITRRTQPALLIQRVACEEERNVWDRLPQALQRRAFFRLWTRKEAYIKAVGIGLGLDLKKIEVSLGEDAVLREATHEGATPEVWEMRHLTVDETHIGALVMEGNLKKMNTWAWRLP